MKYQIIAKGAIYFFMLKNEQECFIGFKTTKRSPVVLDPIKHVLRVFFFFNGFKNISGKACVNRAHDNYAFMNVGN